MANIQHPLYKDIHSILLKFVGFDQILDKVTSQIGDLKAAYVTGELAIGHDSQVIDLILIGDKMDRNYITNLIEKAEKLTMRKIRFLILTMEEAVRHFKRYSPLTDMEKRQYRGYKQCQLNVLCKYFCNKNISSK